MDARQAPRLALCYLAVRAGERLAQGQIAQAADLLLPPADGATEDSDFCHLGSYLALPALARLPQVLQATALPAPAPA